MKMTRQNAKQYIKDNPGEYLKPAKKRGTYICPLCNNGTGSSGDGLTPDPHMPGQYTCFKCGFRGDIIQLIAEAHGIKDGGSAEAFTAAYQEYGIEIDEAAAPQPRTKKQKPAPEPPKDEAPAVDYSDFYRECAARISETDYLQRRGISAATAKRFMLGYCPDWINPTAEKNARDRGSGWTPPSSPRLIIPVNKHCYTARDTRAELTPEQSKYKKQKIGQVSVFNARTLTTAKSPVFVTEGEINALSIIEAGGEAVATGSAAFTGRFVEHLKKNPPTPEALPLLICMDNDPAGQSAAAKLADALTEAKIPFQIVNPPKEYKDTNDALIADRAAFAKWVMTYTDPPAAYMADSAGAHVQAFLNGIAESANMPAISTGFEGLDADLDGGLYEGFYIMGAISSLGKTTFALQLCDQVAQAGHDVIIFSLEMSRYELIAKSISRLTIETAVKNNIDRRNAKSTRGITTGAKWRGYNPTELNLIKTAAEIYQSYADGRIWIYEGVGNIGVNEIRERIEKHIEYTGRRPLVLIDYLQILAPADPHSTDKQNTDKAVLELKRISRDYKIPLIGISSFNRDSYTDPLNMRAFKESGAIEYSSDVLIGLQYEGMEYQEGENDGKRQKRIRELFKTNADAAKRGESIQIELKILKNRNGGKDITRAYTYTPVFNYFREA